MPFELKIETGNEAMSDPHDVAAALRSAANELDRDSDHIVGASTKHAGGMIFDANGNKVGDWTLDLDR